jgi:hypothetical protein
MHIHNVYFWLKDNLDDQALAGFEQGLNALTNDRAAKSGYFGKPAVIDRDVVDRSYSYGLVLVFDDLAAHDAYQTGAVHLRFLADHSLKWKKVIVYDVQTT